MENGTALLFAVGVPIAFFIFSNSTDLDSVCYLQSAKGELFY